MICLSCWLIAVFCLSGNELRRRICPQLNGFMIFTSESLTKPPPSTSTTDRQMLVVSCRRRRSTSSNNDSSVGHCSNYGDNNFGTIMGLPICRISQKTDRQKDVAGPKAHARPSTDDVDDDDFLFNRIAVRFCAFHCRNEPHLNKNISLYIHWA